MTINPQINTLNLLKGVAVKARYAHGLFLESGERSSDVAPETERRLDGWTKLLSEKLHTSEDEAARQIKMLTDKYEKLTGESVALSVALCKVGNVGLSSLENMTNDKYRELLEFCALELAMSSEELDAILVKHHNSQCGDHQDS